MEEDSLRLHLHAACALEDLGHYAVMPSLRLDMLEREWKEPVRDRDKNWALDSQRAILNAPPKETALALGEYPKKDPLGPLLWSPALQSLVRKNKILSAVTVVSHTYCVVDVFGFGISGRLFSEGSNNVGRFLVIECYSVWNSLKYVVMVSALQLRTIFKDNEELLKAGLKTTAVVAILRRLYFNYTVTLTYPSMDQHSSESQRKTQICRHLDPPTIIPNGLPQTIPDLTDYIKTQTATVGSSIHLAMSQELFIDTAILETGPQQSRRSYKRRLQEQEDEYMRMRKLWFDTPLRKRGLVYARATRTRGKILVLSSYKFPKRPLGLAVRVFLPIECGAIPLNLSLLALGPIFKITLNPYTWPPDILQFVTKSATQRIRLRRIETGVFNVYFQLFSSPTQDLTPLSSYSLRHAQTPLACISPPFDSIDSSVHVHNASQCRDPARPFDIGYTIKPRREVGRGVRICGRSIAVQGAPVILSVFLVSPLIPLSTAMPPYFDPSTAVDAEGRVDYDVVNAYFNSLGGCFDLEVEAYVPHGHSVADVSLSGCSTLLTRFNKDDIFRLIRRDMKAYTQLQRVCYQAYYGRSIHADEKREVSGAWSHFLHQLAREAQWGVVRPDAMLTSELERSLQSAEKRLYNRAVQHGAAVSEVPVLVLQWSTEIFRKALKVDDEDSREPQQLLQISIWQRGGRIGVVAYSRFPREVYTAEDEVAAQSSQIEALRCLTSAELCMSLIVYVALSVRYYTLGVQEEGGEVAVSRGVKIINDIGGPRFDVLADDYEQRTDAATLKASEELQRRFINAKKEVLFE